MPRRPQSNRAAIPLEYDSRTILKIRLINFWDALRGSYWFVPTIMSLGAILLSIACVQVDHELTLKGVEKMSWLWAGGADGARAILSTIASSMITVAGVVFSITIVALTLASSQFGPRLLRNFVRDTVNQAVLGTFVATYLYCLLVLREVKDVNDQTFVPYLSITVALALTTAGLGMLIFFIHHVALSIQAESVVASVAAELRTGIAALFPEEAGAGASAPEEDIRKRFDEEETACVNAQHGGYVQGIDLELLMAKATEHHVIFRLHKRPGEFVFAGGGLAEILPAERATDELVGQVAGAYVIAGRRSPRQDAEYCVNQLVEIAVRALSPGVNDPFTAIACIHWLGDAIAMAAEREMPSSHRRNADGELCVVAKVTSFSGLIDAAFNGIRQYGASSPAVVLCLLETLAEVGPHVVRSEDLATLRHHAEMIARDGLAANPDPHDGAEIRVRLATACKVLRGTTTI